MNTPTTQVCTKCHQSKELSRFHRRGNSHQSICKDCRNTKSRETYNERGKTALPRIAKKINPENFPALSQHITKLQSRIRSISGRYAADAHDADDIYSEIVEDILTLCEPGDTDAYLLKRANLTAREHAFKLNTYNQHVDEYVEETDEIDEISMDADETKRGGWKLSETPHEIENFLMRREEAREIEKAIASLPEKNRKIVLMVSTGMSQREIAIELHVSEQSISERLKTVRKQLLVLMEFSPA